MEVIDSIYSHLDKHEFTIGIYLDLQKAFDSVNHKILLKKLYNYGVRGEVHAWFHSYLSDRKQTTLYSGIYSDFEIITCGVPQGSVLGPLLFLIYINDIQYAVSNAKVKLFADDTNLFLHGKSLNELENTANNTLNQLTHWMAVNKLSINIDKTCYSIFGPKNKITKEIKLLVNNIRIKNVNYSKYLGVIIDNKLTWQYHIDYVYNKLLKFTSIFYKIRDQVNTDVLRMIYFAFVHPHILYSIEIYGNTYQTYLSKLLILNNKLLRILQNQSIRTPVGNLYRTFNTLPIPLMHEYRILNFVHTFINNRDKLPDIFVSYFVENRYIHYYDTRKKCDLHLTNVQSSIGKKSISNKGCSLWNKLPNEIKLIHSNKTFKIRLKGYYLESL